MDPAQKQRGETAMATRIVLKLVGAEPEYGKRGEGKKRGKKVKAGARVNAWDMRGDRAPLRANGECLAWRPLEIWPPLMVTVPAESEKSVTTASSSGDIET